MTCPNCSYGMNWRDAKHTPIDEIIGALKWFDGIDRISLTGGEPTAHPHFHQIARLVRQALPEMKLGLETNATLYPKFKESLPMFDSIDATHYTPDAWDGCPDNTAKIELLQKDYPRLRVLKAKHVTMENNRGSNPCGREARAHWSHGLIYGCCAAPGVKGAIGIELQDGWHEKLKATRLPCKNCIYGQP